MGVYVHDTKWASRRTIAFIAMVVLHIILIWGLKSGFAMKIIDTMAPPIETEIIEDTKKDETPPPPPPPKMELPPVEVPPPVVDINIPAPPTTTALSNVTDKPLPPPPPPVKVEAAVVRVPPKLNPRSQQPDSEEYYPPASKRLGETGTTVIKACVDEKGHTTDSTVQESSSIARLDEAAVKYSKAMRFVAGTENGKPVAACLAFKVTFKLKD